MKIIIKRAAAAAAAVVLAFGCTVFSYADSYNTIQITKSQSSKISYNGAEYTAHTGIYSVGGKNYNEHAYAVVAKPGIFTSVEVTSGSSVYGRSTLSQKIASYDPGSGRKVVGLSTPTSFQRRREFRWEYRFQTEWCRQQTTMLMKSP